jgi:hypothetical protein
MLLANTTKTTCNLNPFASRHGWNFGSMIQLNSDLSQQTAVMATELIGLSWWNVRFEFFFRIGFNFTLTTAPISSISLLLYTLSL